MNFKRLAEPSSFAGYAAIAGAVPELIATGGKSPSAWGVVIAAVIAIFKGEATASSVIKA